MYNLNLKWFINAKHEDCWGSLINQLLKNEKLLYYSIPLKSNYFESDLNFVEKEIWAI